MATTYRTFMLTSYEGSETLDTEYLWGLCSADAVHAYRSPLHDSDLWTAEDEAENPARKEGTPKKAHTHIVLYFPDNERTLSSAAKLLGVKKEQLRPWDSVAKAIRYLAHLDNAEKQPYDPASIKSNCSEAEKRLKNAIAKQLEITPKKSKEESKQEEAEFFSELVDLRCDSHMSYRELLKHSIANGRYDVFRRGFCLLKEISEEERTLEKLAIDMETNVLDKINTDMEIFQKMQAHTEETLIKLKQIKKEKKK